jgi:hypothetical protein
MRAIKIGPSSFYTRTRTRKKKSRKKDENKHGEGGGRGEGTWKQESWAKGTMRPKMKGGTRGMTTTTTTTMTMIGIVMILQIQNLREGRGLP